MNVQTYAELLSKKFIRNHEESERIIKFLLEQMAKDVAQGKRVYFRGFGSFKKVKRPAKKFRNMITNTIETRPPKKDIQFNPSQKFLKSL